MRIYAYICVYIYIYTYKYIQVKHLCATLGMPLLKRTDQSSALQGARDTIVRVCSFVLRVLFVACVSIRQHTSAYVKEREGQLCKSRSFYVSCLLVVCVLCVCTVSVLQCACLQTEQACFFSTNARMHTSASSCVHEGGVSICTFVLAKQEK